MSNLICFIASHVTSLRLDYIKELFPTIEKQSQKCPIFISWSSEDEECKLKMEALLEETKSITVLFSKTKLSQFQHYQKLLSTIKDETYIMFSDDDDLWASNRVERMKISLDYVLMKMENKFSRIVFPYFAKLYPSGKTKHNKYQKGDTNIIVDHWASIIPSSVLKEFFHITSKSMIANRYCDTRFCIFTASYKSGNLNQSVIVNDLKPLYIYRIHKNGECINGKKGVHRHKSSFKNVLDYKSTSILALLSLHEVEDFINMLCVNIEIDTIKYYPNTGLIQESLIVNFPCPDDCKHMVKECLDKMWPNICQWIGETYAK
jgi:hypothetical protein